MNPADHFFCSRRTFPSTTFCFDSLGYSLGVTSASLATPLNQSLAAPPPPEPRLDTQVWIEKHLASIPEEWRAPTRRSIYDVDDDEDGSKFPREYCYEVKYCNSCETRWRCYNLAFDIHRMSYCPPCNNLRLAYGCSLDERRELELAITYRKEREEERVRLHEQMREDITKIPKAPLSEGE